MRVHVAVTWTGSEAYISMHVRTDLEFLPGRQVRGKSETLWPLSKRDKGIKGTTVQCLSRPLLYILIHCLPYVEQSAKVCHSFSVHFLYNELVSLQKKHQFFLYL